MNPADYAWPVPSTADAARALAGISGDIARGLPPKLDEALIFLAAVYAADPGPDQPVPYALTAKAHTVLDQDDTADRPGPGEFSCSGCGDAWFGTPPDDGLCPACRPGLEGP
jgi:hypothetical protein